jgi:NAD(P)-dependent dehydrogenase (short-subunit alcohol dehydrogenase family)
VNLEGSVAIVTGGGTGIGRAVCEQLALAGAGAVIVNYSRSADDAVATVARLVKSGCRATAVQANVADDDAVRAMVDDVATREGRLDVLVNNAGTTVYAPFPDLDALTDEVWRELLDVNLLGAFYCARAAGPALRAARGAVVNIASTAGYRASGSSLAYGVSKAALLQLTRGLAVALAPDVRVNAVSPGMVTTRWHGDLFGAEQAEDNARAEAARVPLGQVAGAADIADVVMGFLRSDLVTGESLIVDGGKHLLY